MNKMMTIGELTARYGVAGILIAFGVFKFTNTEAHLVTCASWINSGISFLLSVHAQE